MFRMNGRVTVVPVDRESYERGSGACALAPFQEAAWLEALRGPGRQPAYFEFRCDNCVVGLVGGLDVASPNRWLTDLSRHFYLYGFPVIQPERAGAAWEALKALLREQNFNSVDVAYYDNPSTLRLAEFGLRARPAAEYRVDLSPPLAELQGKLNRSRRRLLKRAAQNSLVYEESRDVAKLDDLTMCLGETKERRAERGVGHYHCYYIPFLDEAALRRLLECGLGRVCCVSHQGRVVSAGFFVRNARRAYYILAGATREGYELGASTYMQWQVIAQARAAGCEWLNLGGVPHDESAAQLVQFKESFGARPHRCEAGNCFLVGGWRKWLYRAWNVAAHPANLIPTLRDKFLPGRRRSAKGVAMLSNQAP